jgi:large subunit ribosomal protein L24
MTKLKLKKGATVQVIAGNDKGKKGAVLEINPGKMLVKVQGVKVMTHFDKKDGLLKKEGFIHYSNVKLLEKAPEKKSAGKKASKAKSA